jgi:hypothetical protein
MKPKKTRGDGKDGADKEGARNTWLDRRSVVDRSTDHLLVSLNSVHRQRLVEAPKPKQKSSFTSLMSSQGVPKTRETLFDLDLAAALVSCPAFWRVDTSFFFFKSDIDSQANGKQTSHSFPH